MNFLKKVAAATAVVAMAAAPSAAQMACSEVTSPTLDESLTSITGQNLVVTVHAPSKYTKFTIDWDSTDIVFDGTDECSLEARDDSGTWVIDNSATGGSEWAVAAQTCTGGDAGDFRTFTFTRNLADSLSACAFTNAQNEVFDNTLTFTTTESTSGVFGTGVDRVDQTSKSLQITLPTSTSVSSTPLDVFNGAITFGQLSTTAINLNTDTITATFTTSVQYPYKLSASPAVADDSANWNIATDASPTDGTDCGVENDACTQTWTFPITEALADRCAIDGTYTITFTVECASSFGGACDGPAPQPDPLEFSLSSSSYCPDVVEVATVTPTMTLYTSEEARNTGTTPASDYIYGTILYVRTDFAVESGLALTGTRLISVDIDNQCISCTDDGAVSLVASGARIEPLATNVEFASESLVPGDAATTTPTRYDFEYRLTAGSVVFDNDLTTGNSVQTVTAVFVIDYDDAVNQKRQRILRVPVTMAGVSVGQGASATFRTSSTSSSTSTSQATVLGVSQGTVIAVGVALGAVAIIAVGAAVGIKRRSAAASADASAKKIQSSSSSAALELESAAGQPAVGTGDLRTVQTAYDATQA